MNIAMRHLRYFVAVAEEASFTAAAQRVHVAQQVMSGRGIGIPFIVARGGAGWPSLYPR